MTIMTERQSKNILRANWFTTILTWAGAAVVLFTSFYFNTNNSVAAHETKLKTHDVKIEKLEGDVTKKADMSYVDQMRTERESQIKLLQSEKADKDDMLLINQQFNQIMTMLRDVNQKFDRHIDKHIEKDK